MTTDSYVTEAVALLSELIATPRTSRNETRAADILEDFMRKCSLNTQRTGNNIISLCNDYDEKKPTLLLNAHIDTVKPTPSWTRNPYEPTIEGDRLYGIGSNDCGGGLMALLQAYRLTLHLPRRYNTIYVASAEEEVSGAQGISSVLPLLPKIDVAIVGEPTGMQPATAERGLMVIDATAHGRSGHAARSEGINAIYAAADDLLWLRGHRFERVSELLGPVKTSVTVINAGTQHNVIPDECRFIIDVRTNELYTNEEVFDIIRSSLHSEVKARSFRLHSSSIPVNHPIIKQLIAMGKRPFGSPTLSDRALMPFPSVKIGPGSSSRSHSADEYIKISEIKEAIDLYTQLITSVQ